ncbi:MAG: EAL domain-containing protein [bacterium]
MSDGWFRRLSTQTLSRVLFALLLALVVVTGISIGHFQGQSRVAEGHAAVRLVAASRVEATMALSRNRSDALGAVIAGPTAPARAAAEHRLAMITGEWQSAILALRAPYEAGTDALLPHELSAAVRRVADLQSGVLQALARNDVAGAQRIYVEREIEAENALQSSMGRLADSYRIGAAAIAAETAERTRRLFLLFAAVVVLVIVGIGIAGHALIRRTHQIESDLHRARSRSDVALHSINDGVITVDGEGHVEFMNPIAESLTGWRSEDARKRPLADVYILIDERTREVQCFEPWRAAVVPQRRHEGETPLRLTSRDGTEVSIRHSFSQVVDPAGDIGGAIIVFHDDTSLRTLAQQLSWQASHDALTGLANRREFERALSDLLASSSGGHKTHALLYIDLDHFKAVNDSSGHAAGDELLCQLTKVMQAQMRANDVLARLGGDEFGALLDSCPADQAMRIATALHDAVNAFVFVWQGRRFKVGSTIGLLPIDAGSGSVAQVIAAADALCYQAKSEGRDRIRVYRPDGDEGRRRSSDARMITRISEAFESGRFVLYARPVSPLRAELAGSDHRDVMVRMLDADDNLLAPSSFLPAAERYELLTSIDRWVLRTLAVHLSERQSRDDGRAVRPLRHSVNVSARSLQDPEFRAFVFGLIDSHRLPRGQLCLELTEVGAAANLTRIAEGMQELHAAGCSFALDDFGAGLSSFAFVRHLPIDYLKIDAGFVRHMIDDPMDHAIVDSIVRIGHALGIRTIALGVDDADIAEKLCTMGVDYAQGNQYGSPRPLVEGVPRPERATPMHAPPLAPQSFTLGGDASGKSVH